MHHSRLDMRRPRGRLWSLMPLSKIFHYIFIGGGNQSTLGKPPTCHKSLTSHNVVSSTPHHEWGSTHNFSGGGRH
jgi:hypothetical protein